MFGGKKLQVRQARHGAVILHDLADHGGRAAAGHGGQVAAGLSVTGTHQHAAINSLQREDVAGLHQIFGFRILGHCCLHGARAVRCRDAGGDAFGGLNGRGKGRALLVAIARRHGRQLQALAVFAAERQADQAAPETRHEVDGVGADVVGCHQQIAFVLAVFFVNQNDDASGAQVSHDVFNRGDGHRGKGGHAGNFQKMSGAQRRAESGRVLPDGLWVGLQHALDIARDEVDFQVYL